MCKQRWRMDVDALLVDARASFRMLPSHRLSLEAFTGGHHGLAALTQPCKLGECEDKLKAATQDAERDEARAGKELEAMAAKVADFEELSLRCRNLEAAVGATEKRAKAEGERAADAE